ncbi:MAG: PTS glucose transporter subunit IIA, partial [Lachnospiraceae bacterium]|nr:PTS glucose transporter subunit IIA [Lachnospiraceae bacterium]
GAFNAPTVVAGLHHMYNAIEAGLISADGKNIWMPIATAANVAQGAAALALAIKTKNKKAKSVALPASLSAFLGITEPAIFGVNLRYVKPFIAGCIGGCVGGLVAGMTHVWASAYGITGVFGFLITTNNTMGYLLVMVVSAGIAFAVSWILHKDEEEETPASAETTGGSAAAPVSNANMGEVYSPLSGEAIAMENVPDDTFAAKVLGDGMAVVPSEGKVYAPFDGTVDMVYDTKHALGLSQGDMEMLIHVGINTVELNGQFFKAHVSDGQSVRKGDLLLEFDMDGIKNAGYNLTTPVIITNSDDYENLWKKDAGAIRHGDLLMKI